LTPGPGALGFLVNEYVVEKAIKPIAHGAACIPQVPLADRAFDAVLNQIVRQIGTTRQRQSVTPKMWDFSRNQPLQLFMIATRHQLSFLDKSTNLVTLT
jgi:hypothetical protein